MKEGIHPKYHEIEARCACGATWKTRSTKPELHLEICNNCHPFFTGRQKLIDTEGRVERFTKRFGAQTSETRKAAAKTAKTARRDRRREEDRRRRDRGSHRSDSATATVAASPARYAGSIASHLREELAVVPLRRSFSRGGPAGAVWLFWLADASASPSSHSSRSCSVSSFAPS